MCEALKEVKSLNMNLFLNFFATALKIVNEC